MAIMAHQIAKNMFWCAGNHGILAAPNCKKHVLVRPKDSWNGRTKLNNRG
jgi:hypothetical protein